LAVRVIEEHDEALGRMVDQVDARLRALRMTSVMAGVDIDPLPRRAGHAADSVAAGYALFVAEKP
jgi:arsenite methyltransferase